MEKMIGGVTKKVGELTDKVGDITKKVGAYTGSLFITTINVDVDSVELLWLIN